MIRNLPCQNRFDIMVRELSEFSHALDLHRSGRRYGNDKIDRSISAGFKQQGDVEHANLGASTPGVSQKALLSHSHQRMHDSLELGQLAWIRQHQAAQSAAIKPVLAERRREHRF